MIYDFIIFIASLAVLVKSSDYLVQSATKLAKAIGVSEFFIGLTLVAFGTSVPELVSSAASAVYKNSGLVMGNILGSNIANIGLILAVGAVIAPILIRKRMFSREGLFLLAVSLGFFAMSFDRIISFAEGIAMLAVFLAYIAYLAETDLFHGALERFFRQLLRARLGEGIKGLRRAYQGHKDNTEKNNNGGAGFAFIAKHLAVIALSCFALYFSSKYLVPSAHNIAVGLGVRDSIVGVTMLAVGTSLPELLVTISAARMGKGDLLVGNILGSNIANILLVIGISAAITPLSVSAISLYYFFPSMLVMVLLLLAFIRAHWAVRMLQGLLLLLAYAIFIGALIYLVKAGFGQSI